MKNIFITVLLLLFSKCTTEKHVKNGSYRDIQLSYSNGWDVSSSLKVTEMDSVVIRDNTTGQCLSGKLEKQQRITLDSFLLQIDLFGFDSVYKPIGYSMSDCSTFRLFVRTDNQQKTITSKCVAPEQLKLFKRWLVQLSRIANIPIDSIGNFNETDSGYCCEQINDGG